MSQAKKEGVFNPASVNMQFGSYEEKRQQLFSHRRQGVLVVDDPFDLPSAFKVTKGSAERWLLVSDREAGIDVLARDQDLTTGAKCKYLAIDATFDVCSPDFGQLLTIHGFVRLYSITSLNVA